MPSTKALGNLQIMERHGMKMKLTLEGLKDKDTWKEAGYVLPEFDHEKVRNATMEAPTWIHFGAGNIFRAFQANVLQTILNKDEDAKGLIAVEGYDYEIIEKMYRPHDNLSILATLKADGTVTKAVVGSIVESLILDSSNPEQYGRLKTIFANPSLQMASFTITEKGYQLVNGKGELLPDVVSDFMEGPRQPKSYLGKVVSLLYHRYQMGALPLAMVSMDNCSHNGDRLRDAVTSFASAWCEKELAENGFLSYVNSYVSFPWTMIDKITPRPDDKVKAMLAADRIEDLEQVITSKNTYVAPFVNAEECEYLVIEDDFPNGRPPLEMGGVIFTDRATVDKVEKMKVCTCLNPLHTSLAIFGCLLGYDLICEEMKDPLLRKLAEVVGYKEGLPVVVDPGIISPRKFIDEVLQSRISNPFMPDTPQRIATDTSQKLAIRFGETIKSYAGDPKLQVLDLKIIPLVLAGWLRYLMGIDDDGKPFALSPDPLLDTVCPRVSSYGLDQPVTDFEPLRPILSDSHIMGVNLYEVGLADVVCEDFAQLCDGTGAVRRTLERLL